MLGNEKKGINAKVVLFGIVIIIIAYLTIPWGMNKFYYDSEPVIKVNNVEIKNKEQHNCLFNEGLVPVCNENDKWGYMNENGQLVIDYKFELANQFSEGLALVATVANKDDEYSDWIFGYINTKGEYIIKPQFEDAGSFHEGLAYIGEVIDDDEERGYVYKLGYINKKGKVVIKGDYEYDDLHYWDNDFSDGMACVCKNGKYGYIDKSGKSIVKPQYDYATSFSEGLAYVADNDDRNFLEYTKDVITQGKRGMGRFINKRGEVVIDCSKFYNVKPFHKGVSWVYDGKERWGILDKKGNFSGFKYTFENKVFDESFLAEDDVVRFDSNGYALVYEDKKAKIINTKGDVIDDNFDIGRNRYYYSNGLLIKEEQNGYKLDRAFTDDGYAILINESGMMQYKIVDKEGNKLFTNFNNGYFYGINHYAH